MEYANTISGLQAKRIEIVQAIEVNKAELAKLSNDRLAIERALRAFGNSDYAEAPKVYEIIFERGELRRFVCDWLRVNGQQTTSQITLAIIDKRGEDPNDREYYAKIQRAVSRCLAHMASSGQAVRDKSGGMKAYGWALPE
jgi:hypothetical protein